MFAKGSGLDTLSLLSGDLLAMEPFRNFFVEGWEPTGGKLVSPVLITPPEANRLETVP